MEVDPADAAGSSERGGETFHFCSAACRDRFDSGGAPEEHLCCKVL